MRVVNADAVKEALRNRISENIDECINNVPTVDVLEQIRQEIDRQEKWLLQAGYTAYNVDIAFDSIKSVLAESEVQDASID